MIANLIINFIIGALMVLSFPFRALPDVVLDPNVASSLATAGGYAQAVNQIFPVITLISILGLFFSVETAIGIYKVARWIYSKIPGVN